MAFSNHSESDLVSEINMIPLIDVMLVLLIVFMITVPVMTHTIKVQLPQAASTPEPTPPEALRISINAQGQLHWNDAAVSATELAQHLAKAAQQQPQPVVQIRGDQAVRYEFVAQAMAAAQRAGLHKLAVLTEP